MKERIKKILSHRERKVIADQRLRPSGVLVPIFYKDESYHLLFTKRTQKVTHHKGQISFPGGAYEEGDRRLRVTAVRESYEEVGIKSEDIEILGKLDDAITTSMFVITPFVGFIPYPYEFTLSTDEIDEILEIPIHDLLDESRFREELRTFEEGPRMVYFFEYEDHVIWGASADILKQFLDLLFKD
ncbi:MAG: CoA pyrophosphatase [Thermodesulfobacteriota bacterium]|nr:CoA pyrophosphatase [Thermodesulfobacteriota bacterium]